MWFAVAVFFVSLGAMFLLAPKPKIENARAGALSDFTFPRSKEGDPVGLVYGTVRLRSPNTLWYGCFRSTAITQKVKTGLFSSKNQVVGYKYYLSIDLGLCLGAGSVPTGPGVALKKIWFGKNLVWTGNIVGEGTGTINLPELYGGEDKNGGVSGTFRFYGGSFTQSQNALIAAATGKPYPSYNGISHIVFEDFYFGNSTNIEAINVEVQHFTYALTGGEQIMPNGLDQNPAETLYDLFTNTWGRLGTDTASMDVTSFVNSGNTLYTEAMNNSMEIANANTGGDLAKEILRQINGILYQDPTTAKICLKLIRNDYTVESLPVITTSKITEIQSFNKSLWSDTFNQVRVKFRNRDNNYSDSAAIWQDFGNINMQQRVRSSDVSMPGVYDATTASKIAALLGAQMNVPLFSCAFESNREIANLKPGDVFVLNWPEYSISSVVMRVRSFDAGELANGRYVLQCTQDEFASTVVVYDPPVVPIWTAPVLTPSAITKYQVIAAPYWFQANSPYTVASGQALLWAIARKASSYSQGYNMQSSTDSFATSAMLVDNAPYGGAANIVSAYNKSTAFSNGFDNSGTGIVIQTLDGAYSPITGLDASTQSSGANLALIGNEIISYRTVDTSGLPAGQYRLTNIHRALFDTKMEDHLANKDIYFLSSIDGLSVTVFNGTDTPTVRLQDRSPQGTYPLASAANIGPISISSRPDRPAPPTMVSFNGVRSGSGYSSSAAVVSWYERNRLDATVRFYNDATQAPEAGQDNEVKFRIFRLASGSWGPHTTTYVSGTSTTINTTASDSDGDTLEIEVRSRKGGVLSLNADVISITLLHAPTLDSSVVKMDNTTYTMDKQ